MLSKTKKIALLTTGLVGALVTSSAVGVALSSCTTTTTTTEDNTKYNTYINWSNPDALANLVVDESGLVYSDIHKTTIIAVTPSFTSTTVTIPASVTSITGYTEVLPSGATIVRGAFQPSASTGTGDSAQSGVTLNNLVTTVKFAANSKLKAIGANAFNGCTLLQSVDLPSTVTMVGANAFRGCSLLNSINLTNVEYIGDYAFNGVASNLANPSIEISLNKATVIGNYAFQNAKITKVDLSANTSLISLGNYAFSGCSLLTGTIDLSKATSLLNTGTYTFQNCTGITAVNLPNSLTTIGDYAFSGCTSIANTIDISGATKLSKIGVSAFANCTSLTGLSYPTSAPLTTFGSNAFSGCTALTQLGTVANTFTAPTALTTIASLAFAGTKIATVDISNMKSAEPFATKALANMTSLSKVVFNSTITTLPANLFQGDTSLTDIKLPKSITAVTSTPTTAITTPDGYSAFYGSSLKSIDMSEITSYVVSSNTGSDTTVPPYLFYGLTSLENVVLKTGTTAINQYAFYGTSSLNSVKESSQTTTTTGYTTTDTLTSIGTSAFAKSGLPSFTVTAIKQAEGSSNTVFNLDQEVFQGATSLKTVDLSKATGLTSIPQGTFSGATGLTTVLLPTPTDATNSTLAIADQAFSGVTSLQSIDFSKFKSLQIGVNNFTGASALKSINLSGLTSIPEFISTSTSRAVFTDLPSDAVVTLSSAINAITNDQVFTQTKAESATEYTRVALKYPNGVTFSSTQLSNGVLSGVNTLLNNVIGDLDLSSTNPNLTTLGINTLFGNANITSLTLPASKITSSTNLYTLSDSVTAQTPPSAASAVASTESQYTSANVPLGNNSKLTNINFDSFDLSPQVVGAGGLTAATFAAIAQIMNSYANLPSTGIDTTGTNAPVNFKSWESGSTNSWIQSDAELAYAPNTTTNKGGTITLTNVTLSETGNTITLTDGTSASYVLTHNNIKWNLKYDASAQTLTLTSDSSTPANIYRGRKGTTSNYLQVYVKTNNSGAIDTSGVQVTMSIKLIKASSN